MTLEQIRLFLKSSAGLEMKGASRDEKYAWMEDVLKRFKYFSLGKKDKGTMRGYIRRMSGFSRAQVTRLISQALLEGRLKSSIGLGRRFNVLYTTSDKELLAQTDNAHERLSGPATRRILERQYEAGDNRFERLRKISSSHIYNLRKSRSYRLRAKTFAKTRAVSAHIGIRRRPEPMGKPGYIRVDSVHQGDKDNEKGVYHINLVDTVLQWEIIVCVENITQAHLEPALEIALMEFPFTILSFHSDNGSEYINAIVAKLLNKLLIEQTKSRSGRSVDNALVEGKNGSVIRKHMGYWHIGKKHAPSVNAFYRAHFNDYLNFHRPCGFATVTVDEKGKRQRKYETYQTPYERLKFVDPKGECLREGISFNSLEKIASHQTDNEAAEDMQAAKARLFRTIINQRDIPRRISEAVAA